MSTMFTMKRNEARQAGGLFLYQTLKTMANAALDLIFPPSCVHCGRVDFTFCDVCFVELAAVPIHNFATNLSGLNAVVSTALHEGVMLSAVQALKYYNARHLARPLGLRLFQSLQQLKWSFDIIVPVPLHSSRFVERGYNQSQELANFIADSTQRPCIPDAILRQYNTESQVKLSRAERLVNLNGAFIAQSESVNNRVVLLVDDVRTTGTTLLKCAEASLQAGALAVYGLTVTTARI